MFTILQQPFPPFQSSRQKLIVALAFGAFIALFLLVFRPFGLNELSMPGTEWIIAGYGAITTVLLLFSFFVLPRLVGLRFRETNWTVWKEILITLISMPLVGVANLLYSYYWGFFPLSWHALFSFIWITISVGILPVSFVIIFRQMELLRRNAQKAMEINHQLQPPHIAPMAEKMIPIQSDNGREESFALNDLLYISAADNYIEVHYLQNGQEEKSLFRTTLKKAEAGLEHEPALYRCHRSYIVNLDKVIHVKGNAQGLFLTLQGASAEVPVSRSLNKEIAGKLSHLP